MLRQGDQGEVMLGDIFGYLKREKVFHEGLVGAFGRCGLDAGKRGFALWTNLMDFLMIWAVSYF